MIISGLKGTFIKKYIVERINKAEIRQEEQSEKAESFRESVWNEIQLKGPWRQKQTQERNKKEWARSVGLCQGINRNIPSTWREPVGTADMSRLDHIRWQCDAETEKERPTQPSCIMLNMTRRGRHWRLYDSEIQKRGKPLLYDVQYDSERQALPPWPKAANAAILCAGEVDAARRTLPSRVVSNMTQRCKHCRLVWCWIRPRCKLRWTYVKRWWEACPGVVSRNGDVGDIK